MAVALYLVVAHDRGSEGQVRPADPAPAPANAQTAGAPPAAASPRAGRGHAGFPSAGADRSGTCLTCHSDRVKAGGLALSELNLNAVGQHAEIAEKVIRKLRGGLMPPAGAGARTTSPRPPSSRGSKKKSTRAMRSPLPGVCRCAASIAGSISTPFATCSG